MLKIIASSVLLMVLAVPAFAGTRHHRGHHAHYHHHHAHHHHHKA